MDILMAERSSPLAAAVAQTFGDHGHVVHTCREVGASEEIPCAAWGEAGCPLDARPVDVAVGVGPEPAAGYLGEGDVCAIRRRIPLVLLDRQHDRLRRWAAAVAPASQAVEVIRRVNAAILPEHSSGASRMAREELRRMDQDATDVDVEVWRRHGGLQVELSIYGPLIKGDAERLAVHVSQYLRHLDPWAMSIDISIRTRPIGDHQQRWGSLRPE